VSAHNVLQQLPETVSGDFAKLSFGAAIWGFGSAGGPVDLDELFVLSSLQQSHAHVLAKGFLDFRELSGQLLDDLFDATPAVAEAEEIGHPLRDPVNASAGRRHGARDVKVPAPGLNGILLKLQGIDDALDVAGELENHNAISSDRDICRPQGGSGREQIAGRHGSGIGCCAASQGVLIVQ